MKNNTLADMAKDDNNIVIGNAFTRKNKELYALARWAALYESVNMIADKAEERKLSFETIELKPLKILEYIDSTSDIIMRKLLDEKNSQDNLQTTPL